MFSVSHSILLHGIISVSDITVCHALAWCGNGVQIAEIAVILMECASPMTAGDERSVLDWANHLSTAAEASRLAVRLHLLTLLFAVG